MVLRPFWNNACPTLSRAFTQPSPLRNEKNRSWFSFRTCASTVLPPAGPLPFVLNCPVAPTQAVCDTSTRKVQIFAKGQTKVQLKQWFGCARATYNWALESIKADKVPKQHFTDLYKLRKRFVTAQHVPKRKAYLLETPKLIRDGALKDLTIAYKAGFKLWKKTGKNFDIKFRRRRCEQSIVIPKSSIFVDRARGELKIYPRILQGSLKFNIRNLPEGAPSRDCRLTLDSVGKFHLCVPLDVPHPEARDNQASGRVFAALDPGVRNFMTGFGSDGQHFQFGHNDISRIQRLCTHLDRAVSEKRKGVCYKIRERIKNLVTELHWKTIKYLTDNFTDVLIPTFETSQMVRRGMRKINSKTARNMMCWSHFNFRMRLLQKACSRGVAVHVVGEEFTTKTCSSCGLLNQSVGGSKVFRCQRCGMCIDRDLNGAKNILLKNTVRAVEG